MARNVVTGALEGYNGTIFAYGQTGSGKTFTITGGPERYVDRGIIPRSISTIFNEIAKRSDYQYTVRAVAGAAGVSREVEGASDVSCAEPACQAPLAAGRIVEHLPGPPAAACGQLRQHLRLRGMRCGRGHHMPNGPF